MKQCACFFACMFIGILALNHATAQELAGAFEIKMGDAKNSVELRLECENESTCIFLKISRHGTGAPTHDIHMLGEVRPVENPVEASNALSYAVEQRTRPIRHAEYADLMKRLSPVLSTAPTVKKCWDLNYSSPSYMLACVVSDSSAGTAPIYLFATLLTSCGEAFCRYIILPMTRVK